MKKLLMMTGILTVLAVSPAFAHGDEDHGNHEAAATAEVATPAVNSAATAPEALAEVQSVMGAISEQIASGNLDAVHAEIDKITASSKVLTEKSDIPADKKARLEAALKQLNSQLGKVHEATDGKDVAKSQAEFKKAQGALKLVEASLK